jgi:MFS family permease
LVQVAAGLPIFLFTLPAGALADIIDSRWILIAVEIAIIVVIAAFAMLVSFGLANPAVLLLTIFLVSAGFSLTAPARLSITPLLVTRAELDSYAAAQIALPDWVRARGLAIFLTVFFGAITVGSAVWGRVAGMEGLPVAHFLAAASAVVAIPLTWRWKLATAFENEVPSAIRWNEVRAPPKIAKYGKADGASLIAALLGGPQHVLPLSDALGLECKRTRRWLGNSRGRRQS